MKNGSNVNQCPKFGQCSAPICPLDNNWQKRKHYSEDRVCFYLLEAQKDGSKAIFDSAGLADLYQVMVEVTPAIAASASPLKKAIERASKSGSRMARQFNKGVSA